MKIKKIILVTLILSFCVNLYAQKGGKIMNLPKFDKRNYHFGFILGINQMNFALKTVENYRRLDSLVYVSTTPSMGFNIGIVSSLHLYKHVSVRFIPSLSFGDRSVDYSITSDSSNFTLNKHVESTFMEFPIIFKYTSKRLNNAQAFIIAGGKYAIDMASQADKKNQEFDVPIKLSQHDIQAEFGTGFDFFLPYFKFGIELKMSYGIPHLLKEENNIYTNPIQRLGSKIFLVSFTFEG